MNEQSLTRQERWKRIEVIARIVSSVASTDRDSYPDIPEDTARPIVQGIREGGIYTSHVQADDTVAVVFTNIQASADLQPAAATFRVIDLAGLIR